MQQERSQALNRFFARRRLCELLEEQTLGKDSPEVAAASLRRLSRAAFPTAARVQLFQRLRDQDPAVTPALRWLEELLAAQGTTAEEMVRLDHQRQATMNVTVRYVRRVWVYDDKATVQVSTKAVERAVSDPAYIPSGNASEDPTDKLAKYQRAGFHSPDTTYVGELKFEYRGGVVTQVGPPREEPVRPWKDILGNKD